MKEKQKAMQGLLYNANDEELIRERKHCKDICYAYNQLLPSKVEEHNKLLKQLLYMVGSNCEVLQPFWCDYGYHIRLGKNVFINHHCTMLDCADITIGNHVFIGPACGFYTASHPFDTQQRNAGLEYAKPISVGDNVWIGANVTILPGVHIGENSIIGAGSVVTKDIQDNVMALGNPCHVVKKI